MTGGGSGEGRYLARTSGRAFGRGLIRGCGSILILGLGGLVLLILIAGGFLLGR